MSGCPVCGASQSVPWRTVHGYLLARCPACGLLHVDPVPSELELEAHYQDPGYFDGAAGQGYSDYAAMEKALRPHFARRTADLTRLAHRPGRLLELGCAAGYFLDTARAAGWDVVGVELSRGMAERARREFDLTVYTSLDELPQGRFDAVAMWEVVEHLPEPVRTLSRLRDRLRDGGWMMLSTPNNGHWQALRDPEAWSVYQPPSHLTYFDERTLAGTLERAGFDARSVTVRKTAPLPPLPGWLRRIAAPLQASLTTGQARPWPVALAAWRAIRVFGWGWQRLAHRNDDIFATLEAVAGRPTS